MFSVLLMMDDAKAGEALAAALADGFDAALATSRRDRIRWLDRPPVPGEPPADLLLADCDQQGRLDAVLAELPARPGLVVLLIDAADLAGLSGDEPAFAAADDLLPWPSGPAVIRTSCRRWLATLLSQRRILQLEDKADGLTRENSTLRRKSLTYSEQIKTADFRQASLQQVLDRMDALTRLSHQINSLQLEQIVQLCVERVPDLFGVRLVSLYLHDEPRRTLRLQRHNHPYPINETVSLQEQPNSPMAVAVARRELLVIDDRKWAELANQSIVRAYAHRYGSGNCILAPLLSASRVVGVVNLADRLDGLPFDEITDLQPLRQLSEMLGSSIRNIELYQTVQEQARTDGMTGLANHSTFVRELAREINRARRYGESLSLIIADVDSLKRINDEFGHLAGDRALQLVARQVLHSVRDSDLAARYGGDEFAVLLPSTALASAQAVAERIVAAIRQTPVVHNRLSAHVTVSLGIGQYDGHSAAEQFIEQVDQAMYRAKQEGKNRTASCT